MPTKPIDYLHASDEIISTLKIRADGVDLDPLRYGNIVRDSDKHDPEWKAIDEQL